MIWGKTVPSIDWATFLKQQQPPVYSYSASHGGLRSKEATLCANAI